MNDGVPESRPEHGANLSPGIGLSHRRTRNSNCTTTLLALFLSGIADGVSVVIRQTILQLRTPDEMRGRVSSVNSMFVGSSNEIGAFESGVTVRLMGTVPAVVFGGAMTLLIVMATGALSPTMRRLELDGEGGTEV